MIDLHISEKRLQMFGHMVRRFRKARSMTLNDVADKIMEIMRFSENHKYNDKYDDNWVRRVEMGKVKFLSDFMIDLLFRALDCTQWERTTLLVIANRVELETQPDAVNNALIGFYYIMPDVFPQFDIMLRKIAGAQDIGAITDAERRVLLLTAMKLVIDDIWSGLGSEPTK